MNPPDRRYAPGMVMVVNPSGNKTFDSFKVRCCPLFPRFSAGSLTYDLAQTTALGLNTTALFDSSATALVPQSSLGKMLVVGAVAVLAVSLAL